MTFSTDFEGQYRINSDDYCDSFPLAPPAGQSFQRLKCLPSVCQAKVCSSVSPFEFLKILEVTWKQSVSSTQTQPARSSCYVVISLLRDKDKGAVCFVKDR